MINLRSEKWSLEKLYYSNRVTLIHLCTKAAVLNILEYSTIFFANNTEHSKYNITGETHLSYRALWRSLCLLKQNKIFEESVPNVRLFCIMVQTKDTDTETSSEVWVQGFRIKFHIKKFATVQTFVTSVLGYIWNYFVLH